MFDLDHGLGRPERRVLGQFLHKTFLVGNSAVFIDEVEKEDGLNVAQTSLTVARDNGFPLGAVTIGIHVDALK